MDKNFKPSTRKSDIVVQKTGEEVLIYDLKVDKAFCLNETSALIWQACDGKKLLRKSAILSENNSIQKLMTKLFGWRLTNSANKI